MVQIFLHSEISSFQLSLNLAHDQSWVREDFHNFSTHLLNHSHLTNRVSYSASLFVAEKTNRKDFSIVIFFGDIRTSLTPDPLWFIAPSTYTFQDKGSYKEIALTDYPSMFYFFTFSSIGVLANSATRSARTWPLIEEIWLSALLIASFPRPFEDEFLLLCSCW